MCLDATFINNITFISNAGSGSFVGTIRSEGVAGDMATIQRSNTKVANRLINYAEKRAEVREGVDCPAEYAKSQMKATRELKVS